MDNRQKRKVQFSAIYLIIALIVAWIFQTLIFRPLVIRWSEVPYSQLLAQLDTGEIEAVQLTQDRILYECCPEVEGTEGRVYNIVRVDDPDLIDRLVEAGVEFSGEAPSNALLPTLLGWVIPHR
ncbi:MAG: ATP-dependent metallopeptidase FtsH/Yme1/Tma family protein [Anaerolineae bacterium]